MPEDLLGQLDNWMHSDADNGFTVMFVKTGRDTRLCIMRSQTQTIGKTGEGATCADALAVALGRKPREIPMKPAKQMTGTPLTLPGVPLQTRGL